VGPLFYYELVRLARRGRSNLLRCAYALALFVALFLAYRLRFPRQDLWAHTFKLSRSLPAQELSRLAEVFAYSILWIQATAVTVLAPLYFGSAIAEECERGTLDLLRMTHLSNREIVLGKLFARAAHVGGVFLAGLPLLALTQLWGGVDFRLLLAAFVATGLNLLGVGAICITHSAVHRTSRMAILHSFSVTAAVQMTCWTVVAGRPDELFRTLSEAMAGPTPGLRVDALFSLVAGTGVLLPLVTCVAVNVLAYHFFTRIAIARMNRPRSRWDEKTAGDYFLPRRTPRTLPPVGGRPLLWMEKYRGGGEPVAAAVERMFLKMPSRGLLLAGALSLVLFLVRQSARGSPDAIQVIDAASRGIMVLLAALWCGVVAIRAAGSVSEERDGRTLEVLLSSPVSHASLLWAKWLAAVLSGRVFGYGLVLLAVLELLGGDWHPLGILFLLVMVASHVALLAGFGVWLSLVSRNTLRARVAMAAVVLFLGGGLRLLLAMLGVSPAPSRLTLATDLVSNAPGTWWSLAFTWNDFAKRTAGDALLATRLDVASGGILFLVALASLFWLSAWRRCETGRAF
jgi:ABC-type transport system involved in multi-copper enzyme maturation permease subunit